MKRRTRSPIIPAYAVPRLIEQLRAANPEVRQSAARSLGGLGGGANGTVPALMAALQDTNGGVRFTVTNALERTPAYAVPILIERLQQGSGHAWGTAALELMRFGTYAGPAMPVLLKCLEDGNHSDAPYAAVALGRIGLDEDVVVPALMKTLHATNRLLRHHSVLGFEAFGAKAKPAVPLLVKLLDDPEERVRVSTTNALKEIAPEVLESHAAPARSSRDN